MQTGLQLAVRAIPLAGLSLFILPLPWTLPRLMALQATLPIAVLEGTPQLAVQAMLGFLLKQHHWMQS